MGRVTTPCLEWTGSTNNMGYGRRRDKGRLVFVHRWAVAQVVGWDAIEGKVVMHACDNPLCYRFDHLVIGTQAENVADMVAKGRCNNPIRSHCVNGHEFDDANTYTHSTQGNQECRACRRASQARYRERARV